MQIKYKFFNHFSSYANRCVSLKVSLRLIIVKFPVDLICSHPFINYKGKQTVQFKNFKKEKYAYAKFRLYY